jgi:Tol biopolymer transport system component
VALAARSSGGNGLWLHDVESGEARLLARAGAVTPAAFWAPDSLSVAFCDAAGVQKINLASQLAEAIESPRCTAGSWNVAGDWLLSTDNGLVRMSASGGAPEPLTRVDRSRGELSHAYGQWLPDGRHFVFLKRGQAADTRGIYLQAIGDSAPRRLVDDYSNPVYVAQRPGRGLLLFVRKGTLVAEQFDERALALTGDALRLGDRVRVGITARSGSFAASPRLLVFRSGGGYQPTRLVWVDRNGRQLGEVGPDTAFRLSPSLSPDERTLFYGRFNEDSNDIELWTTDLRRGLSQPFDKQAFTVDSPRVSPDGRRLAFISAQTGVYVPWTMTLEKNSKKPVPGPTSGARYLEWSADSKFLLMRDGDQLRAFPVDSDGPPVTALPHDADDARVSHDGRWLAYTIRESGEREVYVERFGGGARVRVSASGGFQPSWRADDRELFFRATPDRMMSVSVRLGEFPEIGDPVQLFRASFESDGSATPGTDYLVTRDGQRFLITIPVSDVKPLTARLNWQSQLQGGRR